MKLDFYNVYETIKNKLVSENNQAGLKELKRKIVENQNFSQSFLIYNSFKNKNTDLDVIKEFSHGIKTTNKELKTLLEYFNIKEVTIKKPIFESLNNLVNYKNKSLSTNLQTIKEDEQKLNVYLNDDNNEEGEIEQEDELTFNEQSACNIVKENDYKRLNKLSGYIYHLSKNVPGKEKELIQQSLKESLIKAKTDLLENTLNIFYLYTRINEAKTADEQTIKLGNIGGYKKVELFTEEKPQNPEYIILYLEYNIPMFSDNKIDRENEFKDLKKEYIKELRQFLRTNLPTSIFNISDTITDTNGVMVVKGKKSSINLKTQVVLNIKTKEEKKDLDSYKPFATNLIKSLETKLKTVIPQLNDKLHN